MSLMGATDELAELAVDYLRVYALCSPFTTLFYATDNYMRISGYLKANMALCVLMSAISLVLEVLFLGVLGWGIWAAALACSLAMVICLVFSLAPFVMRRATLAFCHPRFTLDLEKRVFACGSPTFLNNVAQRIASIVINAVLVRLGGEAAVSACGVLMFVDGFAQPLFYGTCDALQPAMSYNWGARRYGRVRALEKRCFLAAAAIGAAAVAVVALFPDALIALFMPDATGEVLALSRDALGLFTITYLFRWLAFATQSYMNAIAKPLPASLISVSAALVFPLVSSRSCCSWCCIRSGSRASGSTSPARPCSARCSRWPCPRRRAPRRTVRMPGRASGSLQRPRISKSTCYFLSFCR